MHFKQAGLHLRRVSVAVMVFSLLSASITRAAGASASPSATATPDGDTSVILMLRNPTPILPDSQPASHAERVRAVVDRLRAQADAAQPPVLARLEQMRASGKVKQIQPFWIVNAVAVTVQSSSLAELAALPGVEHISPNRPLRLAETLPQIQTSSPAPNLEQIHAPEVWASGHNGQGIVVANLDTGVSLNAPSLAGKYRGGANSWYDVQNEHATPNDADGHGTGTMDIMVGDSVGVAPGAKWMAVKIFPDPPNQANATDADAIKGLQWVLAPNNDPASAPDVINNSWSDASADPTQPCPDNPTMHAALQALVAADILPIFAAGNYGPGSPSAPAPSSYPEVLAVGAIDSTNTITYFSSRGPSNCRPAGTVFPDLSAPGMSIPFYSPNSILVQGSGTSFAAPHVAGALAVLLSATPHLTAAQQRLALEFAASDLGSPGPDNVYGYGRLDLLAMYTRTLLTHIIFFPVMAVNR